MGFEIKKKQRSMVCMSSKFPKTIVDVWISAGRIAAHEQAELVSCHISPELHGIDLMSKTPDFTAKL
jgi:hypothetical protein